MGTLERMKRRKEYLYKKNPFCRLCKVRMFLNLTSKNINRDDLATIEHENNKYHPEERLKLTTKEESIRAQKFREGRTELLCKKCNSSIADEETKQRPIKDLWDRSGAYPRGHPRHKPRK